MTNYGRQLWKAQRTRRRCLALQLCIVVLLIFSLCSHESRAQATAGPSSAGVTFHYRLPVVDFFLLVRSDAAGITTTLDTPDAAHGAGSLYDYIVSGILFLLLVGLFYLGWRLRLMQRQLRRLAQENEDLAQQKKRYEALFDFAHHGCAVSSLDGRYLMVNREFCHRLAKPAVEIIGKTPVEIGLYSERENAAELDAELVANGYIPPREISTSKASGTAFAVYSRCLVEFDGGPVVYTMIMDITDRKRQEKALKESEESFNRLFRAAPIPMAYAFDLDGYKATTWNDAWYRTFGYEKADADGKSGAEIGLWVNPEDRAEFVNGVRDQNVAIVKEVELRCKDGSIRQCEVYGRFIGKPGQQILAAAYMDVSERRRAEEEREQLQKQLALSQRLESVGQLAGGVAHDYNNMLGVILGHVELAQMKAGEDNPLANHLNEIQKAARKSADLTLQLLAFARKQTISPVVVDVNKAVSATMEMLRWLIGENVELEWLPGQGPYPVKIDPSQFDQILINLCVNARDAITGIGKISIATTYEDLDEDACAKNHYLRAGRYVLIKVSDNGCGMDKMVQTRIFEPFFTTKSLGQGTGLGLATVYGVVKQNNGFITVDSEPGQGAAFKLYFPVAESDFVEHIPEKSPPSHSQRTGETVLVVEDEAVLLEINREMLQDLGYNVLSAGLPGDAVALAKEHEHIDLLITDVVMPEMNGRELEKAIREIHPQIACLFMSGYSSNVISHHGILEKGVSFIQKPFTLHKMSLMVREALDKSSLEDEGERRGL